MTKLENKKIHKLLDHTRNGLLFNRNKLIISSTLKNEFNNQHGRQVIGFEPKALERLISYDWPTNQQQFKRVIKQLVILTNGSYIKDSDVKEQLKDEFRESHSLSRSVIQLDQTLEEINQDVIHLVMQEEKGNKTKTAK